MGKEDEDAQHRLPSWIVGWFYVTAVICTWDASFIVLRPHTLPGGKYSALWKPYKHYITVDKRYQDINDEFVYKQSLMNYVEVTLNILTLFLHYKSSRMTIPLAYTVCVMTWWKTVLYFLMYMNPAIRKGNTPMQELFLVVIPNGIWIVLPALAMMSLWSRMTPGSNHIKYIVKRSTLKDE